MPLNLPSRGAVPCRSVLSTCALVLMAALPALAADPPEAGRVRAACEDLPALQQLADVLDADWNERDADGLAAHYREDAVLALEPSGARAVGRPAVHAYFARSLGALPPDLRHRTVVRQAQALEGGLCLTDSEVAIEREGAAGEGRQRLGDFRTYTLLGRDGSGWKLVAVRAVAIARAPRS